MKDIRLKAWVIVASSAIVLLYVLITIFKKRIGFDTVSSTFECLSNAFFLTGGLITGVGLLVFASNHGMFTGLGYGVKTIFEKRRFKKSFENRKSYGEYREEKLKKKSPFQHFLIIGGALIALSIIFYVISL